MSVKILAVCQLSVNPIQTLLTIWVFLKQRRHKRAYFLPINLAVADLLVGLLSVPLYIVIRTLHKPTRIVEVVFNDVDIFTGISSDSSMYTLAAISLERMFAVGWPFRHRTLNVRVYICAIVTPWIVAAILIGIMSLYRLSIITREFFTSPLLSLLSTPLLVMCFAYCVIWKKRKSPMVNQNHGEARETKLAKTLFLITGASLLTWLPFQIINLLVIFNPNIAIYLFHTPGTVSTIKLLQFSNSLLNVIIYPFRIPEFKNALLQILRCCVVPFQRFNAEVSPSAESGSVVSLIRFTINSQFSSANFSNVEQEGSI